MNAWLWPTTVVFAVIVAGCSRTSDTGGSGSTGSGTSEVPTAKAESEIVSPESRAAAEQIDKYLYAHQVELGPKLKASNFDLSKGPEELDKYRQLLPAELASQFELARPAMMVEMRRGIITHNLQQIKFAMLDFKDKSVTIPGTLGEWAVLMRKDDKNALGYFIEPWGIVPKEAENMASPEQAAWVNSHTIYELIDGGKGLGDIIAIVAIERFDHMPHEPKMMVLSGLAVELMQREEVKQRLGRK